MTATERKFPPCGNPKCSRSTGICGGLTCGWGGIDSNGYWSKPCRICAEHTDKRNAREWPILLVEYARLHFEIPTKDCFDQFRREHDWLFIPAWPRN
jgi:hypothetical protein